MSEKIRYSDEELREFKELILDKLTIARKLFLFYTGAMSHRGSHGTEDTSPVFNILEDGANTLSKEESGELAKRQFKLVAYLEAALVRIENKTYGICRETGKLICKERLRAAPHATLSLEAKIKQGSN